MNQQAVSYNQGYSSTGVPGQPPKQPLNVLNVLFLTGAVVAAINCFARADYNLPVFLFSYLIWEQDTGREQIQRSRVLYLLMFSTFVDFYYIIYWGTSIGSYTDNLDWLSSVYIFTIVMASILMVTKATSSDNILQEKVSVSGITHSLTTFFDFGGASASSQHPNLQQPSQLQAQQANFNSNPQQQGFQQNVYATDSQQLYKQY